ncbi:hypothetical protein Ctob_001588, partial [Chrysochromulina tobinii]
RLRTKYAALLLLHQQALARGARSVRSGGCDLRLKGRVTGWQLCVAFERRHQRLTCLVCRFAASQVHFRAMGTGSAPAPFPVINRKPTLGATLRNFTFGDLCSMFGCTVAGGVWGFAAGKPLRRHGSINLAMTACSVAFAYSFQASWHRLTGQRPNESECYYAGVPFEKVN